MSTAKWQNITGSKKFFMSNPVVVRCKDNRQTGSQANIMRVIKWPFTQSYLLTRRIGLNCDQGIVNKSRGEVQPNLFHCTSNCSEVKTKNILMYTKCTELVIQ